MNPVTDTLEEIRALQPRQLPDFALPPTPTFPSFYQLATEMAAKSPDVQRIGDAIDNLGKDRGTLNELVASARWAIEAAITDLVLIGGKLLVRAIPVAARMILPVPGALPAGMAQLSAMGQQALIEAGRRVAALGAELAPLALQAQSIAAQQPEISQGPGYEPAPDPVLETPPPAPTGPTGPPDPSPEAVPEPEPAEEPAPPASAAGQAAVNAALSQIGTPYVWGGNGDGGFDCSGLTSWAYRQAGIELPRLAEEQTVGRQVSADELQPGDLAVWDGHVAMCIGDGMMVEAGDPVQTNPVRTSNIGMTFKGFWRPTG